VIFFLFVGISLVISKILTTAQRRERYGLLIKGGGRPPSYLEEILIDICHVLHIRTGWDEEIDEAMREAEELMEQSIELQKFYAQEQEKIRKSLDAKKRALQEDEKRMLKGSWKLVAIEDRGKPCPILKSSPEIICIFHDNKVLIRRHATGKRPAEDQSEPYILDPLANPPAIDFTWGETSASKRKVRGIYNLEGNKLRICFSQDDNQRPNQFVSTPDGKSGIIVFERLQR